MLIESCILVGVLVAFAVYLILQAGFVRILFGFVVLSNAVNLLVLLASGAPGNRGVPVLDGTVTPDTAVDPLPQALVLTAIVIGFGVIAYLVVLLYRTFLDQGTANAEELFRPADAAPGTGGVEEGPR